MRLSLYVGGDTQCRIVPFSHPLLFLPVPPRPSRRHGERRKFLDPAQAEADAPAEIEFGAFSLTIWHLVATILL